MFSKRQSSHESLRWALKTTHASKILRSIQFMLYPEQAKDWKWVKFSPNGG